MDGHNGRHGHPQGVADPRRLVRCRGDLYGVITCPHLAAANAHATSANLRVDHPDTARPDHQVVDIASAAGWLAVVKHDKSSG